MSSDLEEGDFIDVLPTDTTPLTVDEDKIFTNLFKNQGKFEKFLNETKDVLLLGGLYVLFSLPYFDEYIFKFFPSAQNSVYILLFVKALFLMLTYFVLKNMYLVRK